VTDPPLLTNSEILDAVAERFDLTDEQARMLDLVTSCFDATFDRL
jgi:hypothetical protein